MDIATTLLEYGAKANAESKAGFTPLHLCSQEGHTDMATLLMEHKADPNHRAKVGHVEMVGHFNLKILRAGHSVFVDSNESNRLSIPPFLLSVTACC
jgi:ankyrin repeat protein